MTSLNQPEPAILSGMLLWAFFRDSGFPYFEISTKQNANIDTDLDLILSLNIL
jgi:hypothetical protein